MRVRLNADVVEKVYTVGNIKLFLTIVKYTPQVIHNYRRQSTKGFNIYAVLFDFTGGLLSVIQLFLDLSEQGNGSQVSTGNGVKFALGNVTMLFDVTLMVQHYVLYWHRDKESTMQEERESSEEDSLLANHEN